jgi:hypothetical protein
VSSSNDDRRAVEYGTVRVDLFAQSAQGVGVALYLVTDEMAIDHRDVSPALPVPQAEFIDDERLGSRMVSAQLLPVETRTYLGIVHDRNPGPPWAM